VDSPAPASPGTGLRAPRLPGWTDDGAGFILALLLWGWVALPLLSGGPAAVKAMLLAKFVLDWHWSWWLAFPVAVAVGLPMAALVAMAPAEGSSSFSGVASADGVRVTTSAPGFLVVEDFVDSGGPTAQAAVSDVEGNRGFASVPYPGELTIAGPGLFAVARNVICERSNGVST